MSAGSVSSLHLIVEVKGKVKMDCELKRHLSPKTVGTILRSLPLEGNAHFLGQSIVYFETMVSSGIERQRKEFKKGDVAFSPGGGSICFFSSDVVTTKAMTPIGKLSGNTEELSLIKPGDVVLLYQATG